jgi:hypothetical protein
MPNTNESKLESPVAQVCGTGWADVDDGHIAALAESLRPLVKAGPGSMLTLLGYKPPYKSEATPFGFMEFWVKSPGEAEIAFSMEFGGQQVERYGFEDLSRSELESVARDGDPINLCASVANFDELWKFTCIFAESSGIASVQLRYGV